MFSGQEIRKNSIGCAEVMLFMPQGLDRFEVTGGTMIKSFLIPLALMPLALFAIFVLGTDVPKTTDMMTTHMLILLHTVRMVLTMALTLGAVYMVARQYDRHKHFGKYVVIANWMNIPFTLLTLPIFVAFFGGFDMESMKSWAIFITIAGYVYTAFVLTHCFRIPWEMGGAVSIVGLAIDQNSFEIANMIQGYIV